jgi:hypothetical protein
MNILSMPFQVNGYGVRLGVMMNPRIRPNQLIFVIGLPGRKESKIEQGKRLIPEWSEYDHEIGFIINNTKAIQKSEL